MVNSKSARRMNGVSHTVLFLLTFLALVPFLILISSSFSEDTQIIKYGYSMFPRGFSMDAYGYILTNFSVIGRAYGVTIAVTVIGTAASLIITNLGAYMLSQDDLPGVKVLMFLVVFTMLFSGGLVPTYYIYTQVFHLKDTLWCLIVPNLLLNAFNIILIRNYYRFSIPKAIVESARIDGAGEFTTFVRIVFPLSLPITATVGCSPPSCSGTTGRTACITSPAPNGIPFSRCCGSCPPRSPSCQTAPTPPRESTGISPPPQSVWPLPWWQSPPSSSPTRFSKNISSRGLRWAL